MSCSCCGRGGGRGACRAGSAGGTCGAGGRARSSRRRRGSRTSGPVGAAFPAARLKSSTNTALYLSYLSFSAAFLVALALFLYCSGLTAKTELECSGASGRGGVQGDSAFSSGPGVVGAQASRKRTHALWRRARRRAVRALPKPGGLGARQRPPRGGGRTASMLTCTAQRGEASAGPLPQARRACH